MTIIIIIIVLLGGRDQNELVEEPFGLLSSCGAQGLTDHEVGRATLTQGIRVGYKVAEGAAERQDCL